jgi:hypothetical protein
MTPLPWTRLVHLSDAELAGHDVAAVNLACAAGLPGAENLDVGRCLARLDDWAGHVGRETTRCAAQFRGNPAAFDNSWGYFRALVLATVLQQDCGVRYDPALIDDDGFFGDAANLFLHGVLTGRGGTCSSLPPVYVAVGRRLDYPLKLVQTGSHLFARWDAPSTGERFNVECTAHGLNCHPDDYYRAWPLPTTPEEVERSGWLVSLTPCEELGAFLAGRGHCCQDNRRHREAATAYAWAASVAPRQGGHEACLRVALRRWREELAQVARSPLPPVTLPDRPRRFPALSLDCEREVAHLEAVESLLRAGEGPRR